MGVALIPISFKELRSFNIPPLRTGYFRDDTWIEPEQKIKLGDIVHVLNFPDGWNVVHVFIELIQHRIVLVVESYDFPEVPGFESAPMIYPTIRREVKLDGLDMHEVEELKDRLKNGTN